MPKSIMKAENIIVTTSNEIIPNDKESKFFNTYSFFSIKNSKTPLYVILDNKSGKTFLKGKIGFLDDVYYLMKDDKYKDGHMNLIDNLKYIYDGRKVSDRTFISSYLDNNDLITLVDDVIFKPVSKRIIFEDGGKFLNEYTPTYHLNPKFNNGNKDEEKFPFIRGLLFNLCANDKGAYEYLLKVLSFSIVKPWIKRHGYLVLQGEGASGKGSFFELIMREIFGKYCIVDNEEILRNNFNEISFQALWIFIEEKDDSQNRQKGSISANIKYISGNTKGMSEGKGTNKKAVNDYRNFGMTSNKFNLGLDLDSDDRRATVLGYSQSLGGSKKKAPAIRKLLVKKIPTELDDFVSYLKNLEFNDEEVFNCYETEARTNLIELDMDNTSLFIAELKKYSNNSLSRIIRDYKFEDNINKTEIDLSENSNSYNMSIYKDSHGDSFILFESLYKLFKQYCDINSKHPVGSNKFSTELSYKTRLKKIKKTISGKQKQVINLNKFLSTFNLKFEEEDNCYNIVEIKSR